jgi:diacylglycerol kinase family enzyme
MRVLMLHNPGAGGRGPDADALLGLIRDAGHDASCISSKDEDWAQRLEDSADLLVAAGGDGTVAQLGRTTVGRDVPIAILPLGTANNIASMLGIADQAPEALIAGWAGAERRPFDVGVARGPWGTFRFFESVGLGLLARSMAHVDHGPAGIVNELGDPVTRLAAARNVFESVLETLTPTEVRLALDGADLSGRFLVVEAMNGAAAGPALRLTHAGNPHDGLIDVVLAGETERQDLMRHLQHPDASASTPLRIRQGRRLTIDCASCLLHLDDELWSGTTGDQQIVLTVEPGALTFLVPA